MKSLRIEFLDDTPDGPRKVRDSNWAGEALLCARDRIDEALRGELFDVSGVYILVGPSELKSAGPKIHFENSVYIGQGDSVRDRLQSHLGQRLFWKTAIVFHRNKPGELNAGNIKYLESRLISLATAAGNFVIENRVAPRLPTLSRAEQVETEEFLGHMLFFMHALGVSIFREQIVPEPTTPSIDEQPPFAIPVELTDLIEQIRNFVVTLPNVETYTTQSPDWRAKVVRGDDSRVFLRVKFRRGWVKIMPTNVGQGRDLHIGDELTADICKELQHAHFNAKGSLDVRARADS